MKKIILLISSIVIVAAAVICAVALFILPGKDDDSGTDVSLFWHGTRHDSFHDTWNHALSSPLFLRKDFTGLYQSGTDYLFPWRSYDVHCNVQS